jgi:RNA polymerase sigma-70 factor (ECF subfamily)
MVVDDDVDDIGGRLASGDEGALKDAYDAHGSLVYSIARRTLPEHTAREVTQDVFVSAWRFHERFDPARGTLAGWLVGITRNKVVDAVRSEQRHVRLREALPDEDGIHHDVVAISDRMLLAQAMAQLSDRAREAVYLSTVEGMTHQEIADRTGHPLGTIKSDIRRGLDRLRRHLEATEEVFA